ncbi:Fc.00g055060.m01.CDS01 [Cosmosporella sp. VM-42]
MAAYSQSTQTKIALGERVKQILAQRLVLDNDPGAIDIDLLLGLLTFLAWGHDNLLHGTPLSLSRYTQMAMTIVFDLRLNKPLIDDSNMLPIGSLPWNRPNARIPARSLEERRGVLGCFVMSSIVSGYFAQIDAMQWTPYMEECLDFLSQNGESLSDEIFVHQVRLQRIAVEVETVRNTTTAPPAFYINALQVKLDQAKSYISPQLLQDGALNAAVYSTELSISGLALSKHHAPIIERLEYLYTCLRTVKSALDSFFKIPLTDYPGISFPYFTQLARYIAVLYKLSTLDDPSWDKCLVRSTVDVIQVMDQLICNIELARAADDKGSAGGLLDRSTRIFMSVRSRCAAKFAEAAEIEDPHNIRSRRVGEGGILLDTLPLEDDWLEGDFSCRFLEGNNFF